MRKSHPKPERLVAGGVSSLHMESPYIEHPSQRQHYSLLIHKNLTLPETKIASENRPLEEEIPILKPPLLWGYVSFKEGTFPQKSGRDSKAGSIVRLEVAALAMAHKTIL